MRERLILFAKRPRLGAVKTRLVPPLRPEEALEAYRAFLEDQIAFVIALGTGSREVEICTDEALTPAPSATSKGPAVALTLQGPGDLGSRMLRAFRRAAAEGVAATVIVGSDAPTLPAARVEQAFVRLAAGASAVVCPAEDGGYVLIGLREPLAALFEDIPWGRPEVLAETRARAARAGGSLEELPGWYDVDDASDLRRLAEELRTNAARAPASAAVLRRLDARRRTVL